MVGPFLAKSLFAKVKWPCRHRRWASRNTTRWGAPFRRRTVYGLAVRLYVINDHRRYLLSSSEHHPFSGHHYDGRIVNPAGQ
jgi:hypothetical protein